MRHLAHAAALAATLTLSSNGHAEPPWSTLNARDLDLAVNAQSEKRGWLKRGLTMSRISCEEADHRTTCRYVVDRLSVVATKGSAQDIAQVLLIRPAAKLWRNKRKAVTLLIDVLEPELNEEKRNALTEKLAVQLTDADAVKLRTANSKWEMTRLPGQKLAFILVSPLKP